MRTWTIRELADEFDVSLRTIRFYEEHGIVEPKRDGQRRVFHERDRTRLALALRGRRIGLSVAESKAIIELYDIAAPLARIFAPVVRRHVPRRSAQGRPRRGRDQLESRRSRLALAVIPCGITMRPSSACATRSARPQGNLATGADKLAFQHKLFVRDRIALLVDDGTFVEDGLLANAAAPGDDLPADGVVTGRALVEGRPVCIMANDPTVKAGSWGARTVESHPLRYALLARPRRRLVDPRAPQSRSVHVPRPGVPAAS